MTIWFFLDSMGVVQVGKCFGEDILHNGYKTGYKVFSTHLNNCYAYGPMLILKIFFGKEIWWILFLACLPTLVPSVELSCLFLIRHLVLGTIWLFGIHIEIACRMRTRNCSVPSTVLVDMLHCKFKLSDLNLYNRTSRTQICTSGCQSS